MILIGLIFLVANCNAVYDSTFNDYAILVSDYAFDWGGDNAVYPTCYDVNDKELQDLYRYADSDIAIFMIGNSIDHTAILPNEFVMNIQDSTKIDYENHDILVMGGNDEVQNMGQVLGMDMMYMQTWNLDEVKQYFFCVSEKKLTRNYNGYYLPLPNKFSNDCNTKTSTDSLDNTYENNPYYNPDPDKADLIIVEIFNDDKESKANFYAPNITIPAGKTVVWINEDSTGTIHNIKSANENEKYDSEDLETYMLFSHKFKNKGEFAYYCTLHPWMTGVITVN